MKNPRYNKAALGSRLKAEGKCLRPPASSPQQGFSLIELLIASVIAASAGALLVGGLVAANRSANLRVNAALTTQALATQLALLDDQLTPQMPTSGPCVAALTACTWTLVWTDAPLAPLVEATLSVSSDDRTAHVVTYRTLAQP